MLIRRLLTYSLLSIMALGAFFGDLQIDIGTQTESRIAISYDGNGVYAAFTGPCPEWQVAWETKCEVAPTKPADQVEKWNGVIDTLNMALAVISALVSPVILFVGWLMSPDWTSGDLFGLRTPMYSLWVTVSNIVYFVYAIMLILIALGTMFGQEKFWYKVMLPKLALGILMVPFTWWFVQWTISISAVVTASVMTIPQETIDAMESQNPSAWYSKNASIPKKISIWGDESKKVEACSEWTCITPKEFLSKSAWMYGPLVVYAYSIFKFENITRLDWPADVATAIAKVVHTSIISTLMFFVFGILVLALAVMLIVRAVKLWAYAIFAPLFTFQFVAGSGMMWDNKDMFSIKEFIGLCFVPAVVWLSLSFWLIMIAAVQWTGGTWWSKWAECELITWCTIMNIMGSANNSITRIWKVAPKAAETTNDTSIENQKVGIAWNLNFQSDSSVTQKQSTSGWGWKDYVTTTTFKWWDISVDFIGKATNQTDTKSTASGSIDSLGGMFGTLIIDIIALVFIWLAFMAAKNISTAVKAALDPFEKIGSSIWGLAKSLPKYTPLPIPGGSLAGASKVVWNAENALISASDERFKNSAAGKLFGWDKVVATVDEKKLADAIKDAKTSTHPAWKTVWEQLEKQTGKDIEHSSMFKDVAWWLKALSDDTERRKALETAWYTSDNARKIIERLKENGWEVNKNDIALMTALKSRIGNAAWAADASKASGYTATDIKWEKDRMEVKIDNIKMQMNTNGSNISPLSDENKKKLAEIIKWVTENEFKDKFSGISDTAVKAIIEEAKKHWWSFKS